MSTVVTRDSTDPYARLHTRWDELQQYLGLVVELATALSPNGLDVHFLNRPPVRHVTSASQLAPCFAAPPAGFTPIVPALQAIWAEKAHVMVEKQVLLILATDGAPTDPAGNPHVAQFLSLMRAKPPRCYMTIIAFTQDEAAVEYLDGLIEGGSRVPGLNVIEEYSAEKKEIEEIQGRGFVLSYGDYVAKTFLGPIDPELDALDRKRPPSEGCCAVA